MRKVLVILLISLHLLGNTELSQLFKLPELIQHYQKTAMQDKSINFFDFVAMHYCGNDGDPFDDTEDGKLPFMSVHHIETIALVNEISSEYPSPLQPYSGKELNVYQSTSELTGFKNSLLRPPCVL